MSAPDLFATIREHIHNFLNCGLFSTNSLEGWLCIFLLGFFAWNLGKKAFKFISWSLAIIILWQIAFWLSQTALNNTIPISNVVKIDIVATLTDFLAPDSRIRIIALAINNYVRDIIMMTYDFITGASLHNAIGGLMP